MTRGASSDAPKAFDQQRPTVADTASVLPVEHHLITGGVLPVVAVVIYLAIVGVRAPWVTTAVAVVAALAIAGLVMVVRGKQPHDRQGHFLGIVCGILGPALVSATALWIVDAHPGPLGLLVAGYLLAVAYLLDGPRRIVVQVFGVALWVGTLAVADVAWITVVGHAVGAVMLLAVVNNAAALQKRRRAEEAASRAHAESLARLLVRVEQVNSLDPEAVLEAVVAGLRDLDVASVEIRRIDEHAHVARLQTGWSRREVPLEPDLPLDLPLQVELRRTGGPVIVEDARTDPRVRRAHIGYHGLLLQRFPVEDGHGMLSVSSYAGPLTSLQQEAARLLATKAAEALERVSELEKDRRIVRELRKLDERTQDFVSTASHELRTPLTVISGLVQTLRDRWDDLGAERRDDLLQRIDANAERLSTIVGSLLDDSALARGDLQPQPTTIKLQQATDRVLNRLATVTAAYPVTSEIENELEVFVDPALFDHVLENLLINVATHTPQGTEVKIRAQERGDDVEVVVADRGPGIDPEELPYVLDRFYRGGDPDRRAARGLGLGLALARQIVRAHGGELEVDSTVGEGTTFRFRVPSAGVQR